MCSPHTPTFNLNDLVCPFVHHFVSLYSKSKGCVTSGIYLFTKVPPSEPDTIICLSNTFPRVLLSYNTLHGLCVTCV